MVTYQTIFGGQINFGHLTLDVQAIVLRVLAMAETHANDAWEFASRCRQLFCRAFGSTDSYQAAMRGPIGEVYRDCFYRIHANSLGKQKSAEFLNSVRYNPLRLLLDRFLDGSWRHQNEFARSAGLSAAQVTRLFKNVLEGDQSGEISVRKLGEALKALNAVPTLTEAPKEGVSKFVSNPTAPTAREWFLVLLVSSITKLLYTGAGQATSVQDIRRYRDALARYLSFSYGVRDYNHLTDLTGRVLRELLTTIRSTREVTEDEMLGMTINPDEFSFELELGPSGTPGFLPSAKKPSSPLLPFDPHDTGAERKTLSDLSNSDWAQMLKEAWQDSGKRVAKWSASPLAASDWDKLWGEMEQK